MENSSMAINWLVALKVVPWSDLAQAAPHIVKSARKLFTSARPRADEGTAAEERSSKALGVDVRLAQVEAATHELRTEQRATADLIRSLAEQNARVVDAIAVLQARIRVLLGLCIVLTLALITLAAWFLK
jgi:hypothetical protein